MEPFSIEPSVKQEICFGEEVMQIKEESQEEMEGNEPPDKLEEKGVPQEETDENEEEKGKRPLSIYLPVKVEQEEEETGRVDDEEEQLEDEAEEEEEELARPVAVFLICKEEPKEEAEEEVKDPLDFSNASVKKEEISEAQGREFTAGGTSCDSQASMGSFVRQCTREETYRCSICQKSISKRRVMGKWRFKAPCFKLSTQDR